MPDNPNVEGVPQPVRAKDFGGVLTQGVSAVDPLTGQYLPADATRGIRVDSKLGLTTSVYTTDVVAGALTPRPANPNRRLIKLFYDAPKDRFLYVLEGGAGPVSSTNFSWKLYGQGFYDPGVGNCSLGAYMAYADDQLAPVGVIKTTEG